MSMMTAETARTKGDRSKFGSVPFFTSGRVSTLLTLLGPFDSEGRSASTVPRVAFEWNRRVNAAAAGYVPAGPLLPVWSVPDTYGDSKASGEVLALIGSDFAAAADLAIRWKVRGDAGAAAGCVNILTAWSAQVLPAAQTNTTGRLVWCNRWPLMIQAAMLVADYSGYTSILDTALQDLTRAGRVLSTAYTKSNNVAVWGVVYELAAASFLGDRSAFDRAIRRWFTLFDSTVVGNVPIGEVYRQDGAQGNGANGLWYSNFLVYAFTVAAEWARFNGEWLYDHTGPDGSTFRGLAEQVRFWTRYPETFVYNTSGTPSSTGRSLPHDEILHALWPSAESQWILNRFPTGNSRDSIGVRGAVLAYRDRPLYG